MQDTDEVTVTTPIKEKKARRPRTREFSLNLLARQAVDGPQCEAFIERDSKDGSVTICSLIPHHMPEDHVSIGTDMCITWRSS